MKYLVNIQTYTFASTGIFYAVKKNRNWCGSTNRKLQNFRTLAFNQKCQKPNKAQKTTRL